MNTDVDTRAGRTLGPPRTLAEARTVYRQAIERDEERHTTATRRARAQAQDWYAGLLLPIRQGDRHDHHA